MVSEVEVCLLNSQVPAIESSLLAGAQESQKKTELIKS